MVTATHTTYTPTKPTKPADARRTVFALAVEGFLDELGDHGRDPHDSASPQKSLTQTTLEAVFLFLRAWDFV